MRFLSILALPLFAATISIAAIIPEPEPEPGSVDIPEADVPIGLSDPTGWTRLDLTDPELDLDALKALYPEEDMENLRENLRAITYKCETTTGSPLADDVAKCGADLQNKPAAQRCTVNNPGGSHCSQLTSRGTAAIGICGGYQQWLNCRYAAFLTAYMIPKCRWRDLMGGLVDMGTGQKLIFYHS
ncbi:hypothetical protein EDC01DRAFT_632332 [Geopyxis carbonaria]|nr:hypothetical protein EDC01DRAFT_632332 [Geopyxis carbonaria]